MRRREGSALRGAGVVFLKELADFLTGARMPVLVALVALFALAVVVFSIREIRNNINNPTDAYLYLRLFTGAGILPLVLTLLIPILAIGLGFDTINGEHNRRTLSRILAQPIYRDALLFGKFLAGLAALTVSLITLWLLIIGLGLVMLGVPPGGEEMVRCFLFLLVSIAYAGVWLALALLCSILFRSAATAVLVALGLWLLLGVALPRLAQPIVEALMAGGDPDNAAYWGMIVARISPATLFSEIALPILDPTRNALSDLNPLIQLYVMQVLRMVPGTTPLGQSIAIALPQFVGLVAGTIVLFVISYVLFQRQEVRA
jgi:ABC-2 type transport system permease protein